MKFRPPDIFLGVFLTVAVFAMGMLFSPAILPPNQTAEHDAHSKQPSDKSAKMDGTESADERIAKYTLWLAVLTAGLVAVSAFQGYFLIRSDKTARIAANAADLSARAAIALELPIIHARPAKFGFGIIQNEDRPRTECFGVQSFDFNNLGRTRASPIELRWGWTVGDKLPKVPAYTLSKSFEMEVILEPDQPATIVELNVSQFDMELAPGDTEKIRNKQTNLWLYCCLIYEDFMQTRHEVGFCWRRRGTIGSRAFLADSTPAYNRKT